MFRNENSTAKFKAQAEELDKFLRDRIERLNQLLVKADPDHRRLIKTERAEAETIHAAFKRIFAGWLLD